MDLFNVLALVGGLALFLFGMNVMGESLERRAGSSLRGLLAKFTTKRSAGFLTGLAITAVIQSSSATTVMVVGFVNSGLMALRQAINVIMGANVGTTVTAWLLSLGGIDGDALWLKLLKPTSFTPVLALIGIVLYMFCKSDKKKDVGMILLGFATLMFGMDAMSDAVAGLRDVPAFQQMFIMFTNPVLGVLVGAILTAIIQSSSASVGILQALATTGSVTYGAAIPIIMGQNIGTCVTALLSSIGANRNAKRAALVHLSFNVIGTVFWLTIFCIVKAIFAPVLLSQSASLFGIAVAHSIFNVLCTLLLLPMTGLLEKLVTVLLPEPKKVEDNSELDERLFNTPAIALERCRIVADEMAHCAVNCLHGAVRCLYDYTPELATEVREGEDKTDHYEDILGTYLVKLSALRIGESDSAEAAMLLKVIGDFERISDLGVDLLCSAEEIREKSIILTDAATRELRTMTTAVEEIVDLALSAFGQNEAEAIAAVEPLEQVIDRLKETLRSNHIARLQKGNCTIEAGFVWSDMLTALERTADHCSNVAGYMMELCKKDMNLHEALRAIKAGAGNFDERYAAYEKKYAI
ncbi:MAG: Na/Pi cotransporter family protein [Clostridia bacterium]|nr:Na/Pi cotransporter family protein [Clostridia bacterium]